MSFFVLRYDLDDELIEIVRSTIEMVGNEVPDDDEHLLSQRLEGIYVDYVAFRKNLLSNEGVEMYESGERGTTDREGLNKLPRSFLVKYDPSNLRNVDDMVRRASLPYRRAMAYDDFLVEFSRTYGS